jgi:hypothetical protein
VGVGVRVQLPARFAAALILSTETLPFFPHKRSSKLVTSCDALNGSHDIDIVPFYGEIVCSIVVGSLNVQADRVASMV